MARGTGIRFEVENNSLQSQNGDVFTMVGLAACKEVFMKRIMLVGVSLSAGADVMAYEEPEYDVLHAAKTYEIRRYESYIVAEVDVAGSFRGAGNKAFRILAGYIFGDNTAQRKMTMTVPVESADTGVKMNMTIPVESRNAELPDDEDSMESASGDVGRFTYAFVMERAFTLNSLPRPDDPRIRFVERPTRTMAVNRYSGSTRESRYEKEKEALLAALDQASVEVIGEPVFARYNGPLTPWFLRRNEVMVEVGYTD